MNAETVLYFVLGVATAVLLYFLWEWMQKDFVLMNAAGHTPVTTSPIA